MTLPQPPGLEPEPPRLPTPPDPPGDESSDPSPAAARTHPARLTLRRALTTPLVLGLVLLGVYLWITNARLDSIEHNSLNGAQVRLDIRQQIELTAVSTFFVLVIALPSGILLTRRFARRAAPFAVALANLGQAAPAIGVLALLTFWLGIGQRTALIGMVAYAVLPVLTNTMAGLAAIDPALLDAARGIGMSPLGVLARVELPLAVPLILAGVRTALVLNVGTGTLASFAGGGGLGNLITAGISTQRMPVLIVGAVLTVCLALLVDWLASLAETVLSPRGLEVPA